MSAVMSVPVTRLMIVSNFIIFQLAWMVCVGAAAHGVAWLGILAVAVAVAIHVVTSEQSAKAITLVLFSILIGTVIEMLLVVIHATQFNSSAFVIAMVPLWIVALWALFATTLNVSLRWLRGHYLLAAAFGAIGGPLSYLAGSKLGALALPLNYSLLAISLCWALVMPLLLIMAKRWDAFA